MVVPVTVAVAATVPQDAEGKHHRRRSSSAAPTSPSAQADLLYNNGSVFGANDWTWRAESGDWRFFFLDVPEEPADGSLFLAQTEWEGTAPYTDIDTLIMGRSENHFQVLGDSVFGGSVHDRHRRWQPEHQHRVRRLAVRHGHRRAEDFVAAPPRRASTRSSCTRSAGRATTSTRRSRSRSAARRWPRRRWTSTARRTRGSFDVTFESSVDLDGLDGRGLRPQPAERDRPRPAHQDDPNDPSSASIKKDITIDHASRLTVSTDAGQRRLRSVRRPRREQRRHLHQRRDRRGVHDRHLERVRRAGRAARRRLPGLGPGLRASPAHRRVELSIDAIQGNDLTVSGVPAGPVAAGHAGHAHGGLLEDDDRRSGATSASCCSGRRRRPTALKVPIKITRN